jgi:cell division protein FtsB
MALRSRRIDLKQGVLVAFLVLVALWLATLVWGLAHKAKIAWQAAQETKAEYAELQGRQAALTATISSLKTPRGQEAAIRQAFGVAKPGEEVIIVVPPKEATTTPPPPGLWERLWGWF